MAYKPPDLSPCLPGSYRNWNKGFKNHAVAIRTGTHDIRYIKIFVCLSDVMLKMGTYLGEFVPVNADHAKFIHLRVLSGQRCVHPVTVPCPACEGQIKSMPPPRFCETSCDQKLEGPDIRRSTCVRWLMVPKTWNAAYRPFYPTWRHPIWSSRWCIHPMGVNMKIGVGGGCAKACLRFHL